MRGDFGSEATLPSRKFPPHVRGGDLVEVQAIALVGNEATGGHTLHPKRHAEATATPTGPVT